MRAPAMKPEAAKSLPQRYLRFSKKMVALSVLLLAGGFGLMVSPWHLGVAVGGACGALALGLFFTAGYYYGCDNETCS